MADLKLKRTITALKKGSIVKAIKTKFRTRHGDCYYRLNDDDDILYPEGLFNKLEKIK